jgi:hypothetical protein
LIYKKLHILTLYFVGTLIITGCINQKTVEEKMFAVLEKVVGVEKGYEDQQAPLVELEKEEKEIYTQISSLQMNNQDEAERLANQALSSIENRKKHLMEEQRSVEASEREFEKLTPLIDKLNNAKLEEKADELTKVMSERYETHRKLVNFYLEALDLDAGLYNMLKEVDRSNEKITSQILLINETYENVLQTNRQFNELTEKFNVAKLSFYKEAGIRVKSNVDKN